MRSKSAAEWTSANDVLFEAEIGVNEDTWQFKVGDGVTAWNSLGYSGGVGTPGADGDPGADGTGGAAIDGTTVYPYSAGGTVLDTTMGYIPFNGTTGDDEDVLGFDSLINDPLLGNGNVLSLQFSVAGLYLVRGDVFVPDVPGALNSCSRVYASMVTEDASGVHQSYHHLTGNDHFFVRANGAPFKFEHTLLITQAMIDENFDEEFDRSFAGSLYLQAYHNAGESVDFSGGLTITRLFEV